MWRTESPSPSFLHLRRRGAAFTLLELLCVVALMAILTGLVLPASFRVQDFARKARTRAQFSHWTLAFEQFRADTGAYPQVSNDGLLDTSRFLAALCGQTSGGAPAPDDTLQGNLRRARYLSVAAGTWLPDDRGGGEVVDAFGNSRLVVMIDSDGDGLIRGDERVVKILARGNTRDGWFGGVAPTDPDLVGGGVIRARVAFYSAGKGETATDYVYSWK